MSRAPRDISIIHAQNSRFVSSDPIRLDSLITELGLVPAKRDTSDIAVKVLRGVGGKCTPTTSDVKQSVRRLEIELIADDSEFVILEFFKSFFPSDIKNDTRGVNHTRTEEPACVWVR